MESLFSEHFGRTPTASQASVEEEDIGIDDDDAEVETNYLQLTTDARVRAFLKSSDTVCDPDLSDRYSDTHSTDDDPDLEKIRLFKSTGCNCNRNCTADMAVSDMYTHVINVREMDTADTHMYLMATLSNQSDSDVTKRGKKRQRNEFNYKGVRICKKTFMLLFDIGKHVIRLCILRIV